MSLVLAPQLDVADERQHTWVCVYRRIHWRIQELVNEVATARSQIANSVPSAQLAAVVYDDKVKTACRLLANTLELYDYFLQHGADVDVATLYENMTSSTKPEVHYILRDRQRRTKQRPQLTCKQTLSCCAHSNNGMLRVN